LAFYFSLKRSFNTMTFIDISNAKLIHACSEFIKTISRYFGRNFWKLKVNFPGNLFLNFVYLNRSNQFMLQLILRQLKMIIIGKVWK
jgi:hypothetical protein